MKNQAAHKFQLIDGQFHPDEAKNILMSLFTSKIEFHQLESFSNHVRLGKDSLFSKNRFQVLMQAIESIQALVQEANATGKRLKIEGTNQISFLD